MKVISYSSYENPAVHINEAIISKIMSLLSFLVVDVDKIMNMVDNIIIVSTNYYLLSTATKHKRIPNL